MKNTRNDIYFSFDRTSTFKETPEGFLQGHAILTNVGVFPYRQADGSILWEFRPPEEVFKQSTLDSLRGKPVTNEHPTEFVTSENARDYTVGSIGESVVQDEDQNIVAFLTIHDKEAVDAIKTGKRGLSCGYAVKVVDHDMSYETYDREYNLIKKTYPCPGVWKGIPYDRIQTDIENNHVSLVERGRAGDAARIRIDGAMIPPEMAPKRTPTPIKKDNMTKIKLDNELEYEVAPEVAVAYKGALKKVDEAALALENQKLDAQKNADEARATLLAKDEKISALEKTIAEEPARLDAAVKARAEILTVAAKHGVELKGDETDHEIRVGVIKKLKPSAKLDGESEAFVSTYFRIALDEATVDAGNTDSLSDAPNAGSSEQKVDHAAARQAAREKMITGN